jgi:hypothetical protein
MSIGRNDPCPCGSGLKYKKCHLAIEEAKPRAAEPHRAPVHDAGLQLVERIGRWAFDRFGRDELDAAASELGLDDVETGMGFIVPWIIFHHEIEGKPVVEWFALEEADNISRRERELIDAQRQSWLGLWEVRETVPGKSMILADLLSGEKRLVQEAAASRTLVARDVIMGRVVDFGDVSVIDGMYPSPLPPEEAAQSVAVVQELLKSKLPIALDRLREHATSLLIVDTWRNAVDDYVERRSTPPRLQNTDGDPFVLTVDRYRFAPADRNMIEAALEALKNASLLEETEDGTRSITFFKRGNRMHEHWENTTIGVVVTSQNELRIETNSTRRGNALRRQIEKAGRGLITGHERTQTDAADLFAKSRDDETPRAAPEPVNPEFQAVILNEKINFYENWINTSIPALGGKTPKQAVRSLRGRKSVDALLKTIENGEARQPEATRYDVNILRRALKMED